MIWVGLDWSYQGGVPCFVGVGIYPGVPASPTKVQSAPSGGLGKDPPEPEGLGQGLEWERGWMGLGCGDQLPGRPSQREK